MIMMDVFHFVYPGCNIKLNLFPRKNNNELKNL